MKCNFNFGLDEYPIFDENYRATLNNNILNYYYQSEIGFETPALFRRYLKNKMSIIMPKYNAIYEAQQKLLVNPIGNIDITETLQRNTTIDGSVEATSAIKSTNLYQDTPQGQLDKTDIDNQTWASNLTQDKRNTQDNTDSNTNSTENYTKRLLGANGRTYSIDVYRKFVDKFDSIDQLIIDELQDLFMGIF